MTREDHHQPISNMQKHPTNTINQTTPPPSAAIHPPATCKPCHLVIHHHGPTNRSKRKSKKILNTPPDTKTHSCIYLFLFRTEEAMPGLQPFASHFPPPISTLCITICNVGGDAGENYCREFPIWASQT